MGHVSVNAAMVYQHRTATRDRAIADSLDAMVHELKRGNPLNSGHVEARRRGRRDFRFRPWSRTVRVTRAFGVGADDGNRTRTVSLGT